MSKKIQELVSDQKTDYLKSVPVSSYFDSEYDGSFPLHNFYVTKFGTIANFYETRQEIKISFIKIIQRLGFERIWSKIRLNGKRHDLEYEVYLKDDCLVRIIYAYERGEEVDYAPPSKSIYITALYIKEESILPIMENITRYVFKKEQGGNISLITQDSRGLDTIAYPVKIANFDIGLHYGDEFYQTKYKKIINRLNEDRGKGILLLHGEPGTGKTYFVRHIAKNVHKEVLFIPPGLAHSISEPSFITFLMKHPNSILIIEDAEKVILSRESGQGISEGVSNILNITDGILSDCLSIQVIATFNTSRENIDSALLRKGRLIAEHKFEKLSIDQANKLLKHLGKDEVVDNPMSLTDIYNIDEEIYVENKKVSSIGFNRY